jgi:hypothetical protein
VDYLRDEDLYFLLSIVCITWIFCIYLQSSLLFTSSIHIHHHRLPNALFTSLFTFINKNSQHERFLLFSVWINLRYI